MARHACIPRRLTAAAIATALGLLLIAGANAAGLIIGNATTSVPRGIYRVAAPERATHVTFCLGARHREAAWYPLFCSPDNPGGTRILKRIAARHPEGHLTVEGDTPRALDSRWLGPVRTDEVRGWWRPLVQIAEPSHGV